MILVILCAFAKDLSQILRMPNELGSKESMKKGLTTARANFVKTTQKALLGLQRERLGRPAWSRMTAGLCD